MQFLEIVHGLGYFNISWPVIEQWVKTYELPKVEQVLVAISPLLLGGKISLTTALQWIEQALIDLNLGKPLPPLPLPQPVV